LNEILAARPRVIEPRQESDPAAYVGDEYAIAVFRGFEQLVLLGFPRRRRLLLFDVAQRDESIALCSNPQADNETHTGRRHRFSANRSMAPPSVGRPGVQSCVLR